MSTSRWFDVLNVVLMVGVVFAVTALALQWVMQ